MSTISTIHREVRATALRKSVSRVPLILDMDLPAGLRGARRESVLTLPLGTGSVLITLLNELVGMGHGSVLLVSPRKHRYFRPLLGSADDSSIRIVHPDGLPEVLAPCEASDYLVIVQPRFWPAWGLNLEAMVRTCEAFHGATHLIAIGDDTGAREQVGCDPNGHIQCIQRLYGEMNWPAAACDRILCSLVPAYLLKRHTIASLGELRSELTMQGVLSQDVPLFCEAFSMTDTQGILELNEHFAAEVMGHSRFKGYSVRSPNVLAGEGCRIHPSARLVGPIILQNGVTIEEGARVVGPAVLGASARVGRRAVLARCVLGIDGRVAEGSLACQQVILRSGPLPPSCDGDDRRSPRPATRPRPAFFKDQWPPAAPDGRRRQAQLAAKRILDLIGASLGLVMLSPLLLTLALLVKLTSRGPVFFIHRRETRGGFEFPCIKFRSMVAHAHRMQRELYRHNQVDGPQFKLARDPRETRLGRWLRATNLDELPQLINVLLGHMSLVGPRPSPFRENQICIPWRRARLSVRPGITGLWQLCRDRRSDGDFHQWIYYDLAYVRHFSVWLDFKILLATMLSLGGRRRVPMSCLIKCPGESG